jgi:capsular polysaccharide biosynthesis protein
VISMSKVPPEPTDDDWLAAEPPIMKTVIEDLQRLKYRAKARWIRILVIALALTAGIVYKVVNKPVHHLAHVTLAIQEGEAAERLELLPVRDLRGYVTTVLMPEDKLLELVERRDLFPLRRTHGDKYAIAELWDMMEVELYRNYFLYDFEESSGEGRSARIGLTVDHSDPDLAYEIARDVATIIINAAAKERDETARKISTGARLASDVVRRRAVEYEVELAALLARRGEAELRGQLGLVAALDEQIKSMEASVHRAREGLEMYAQTTSAEEMRAAVYAAGLSIDVSIVEERRPAGIEPGRYRYAVLSVLVFVTLFIVVALYIGAFDSRIHDLDDVARLGIPVVGQVPGFPGDGVGSLRQRGVTRRGVPWSWQ